MLCIGHPKDVERCKKEFMSTLECEDVRELYEHVGCKIEKTSDSMKFTQPVLLQSFKDEFALPNYTFDTPAIQGQVLEAVKEGEEVSPEVQREYRGGIGKLFYLIRLSRPDIWNAARECARRMTSSCDTHRKAMLRIMKYCLDTPSRGWILKPSRKWDGKTQDIELELTGEADSNYATCKDTRRSVSGIVVKMQDTVIAVKSGM